MSQNFILWITSLKISSGWEGGLEAAMQGKFVIRVLQETNLTGGIHMCYIAGYKVWTAEEESRGGRWWRELQTLSI